MPLSSNLIGVLNTRPLTHAWDIEEWSRQHCGDHFLAWFNSNVANKGPWQGVTATDTPTNRLKFHSFWNNAEQLFGGPATAFQFLSLMSIFANETRADFTPKSEKTGRAGYPGITYLFDRIPNLKRSYNTLDGNKTAYDCFRSEAFRQAHGEKALGAALRQTTDERWRGEAYPRASFPTDTAPAVAGYILEADFMKFRGRGFIQTTGRANYRKLVSFVQEYDGEDGTLDFYALQWQERAVDDVADATSNEDWDRLFGETNLIVATEAIRLHNLSCGNYLALEGEPQAAVRKMGKRISGGDAYADKYLARVTYLVETLAA